MLIRLLDRLFVDLFDIKMFHVQVSHCFVDRWGFKFGKFVLLICSLAEFCKTVLLCYSIAVFQFAVLQITITVTLYAFNMNKCFVNIDSLFSVFDLGNVIVVTNRNILLLSTNFQQYFFVHSTSDIEFYRAKMLNWLNLKRFVKKQLHLSTKLTILS